MDMLQLVLVLADAHCEVRAHHAAGLQVATHGLELSVVFNGADGNVHASGIEPMVTGSPALNAICSSRRDL